jgi:hypothetical protein
LVLKGPYEPGPGQQLIPNKESPPDYQIKHKKMKYAEELNYYFDQYYCRTNHAFDKKKSQIIEDCIKPLNKENFAAKNRLQIR